MIGSLSYLNQDNTSLGNHSGLLRVIRVGLPGL